MLSLSLAVRKGEKLAFSRRLPFQSNALRGARTVSASVNECALINRGLTKELMGMKDTCNYASQSKQSGGC